MWKENDQLFPSALFSVFVSFSCFGSVSPTSLISIIYSIGKQLFSVKKTLWWESECGQMDKNEWMLLHFCWIFKQAAVCWHIPENSFAPKWLKTYINTALRRKSHFFSIHRRTVTQ